MGIAVIPRWTLDAGQHEPTVGAPGGRREPPTIVISSWPAKTPSVRMSRCRAAAAHGGGEKAARLGVRGREGTRDGTASLTAQALLRTHG
ncbi:hypothetical protein ACG7TL_000397 [Trametes sanguinea]